MSNLFTILLFNHTLLLLYIFVAVLAKFFKKTCCHLITNVEVQQHRSGPYKIKLLVNPPHTRSHPPHPPHIRSRALDWNSPNSASGPPPSSFLQRMREAGTNIKRMRRMGTSVRGMGEVGSNVKGISGMGIMEGERGGTMGESVKGKGYNKWIWGKCRKKKKKGLIFIYFWPLINLIIFPI